MSMLYTVFYFCYLKNNKKKNLIYLLVYLGLYRIDCLPIIYELIAKSHQLYRFKILKIISTLIHDLYYRNGCNTHFLRDVTKYDLKKFKNNRKPSECHSFL